MEAQHVARFSAAAVSADVVVPQQGELRGASYQSGGNRAMILEGGPMFAGSDNPGARGFGQRDISQKNWSRGCQRACVSFFRSAPWSIWLAVPAPKPTKLSLWSRQSRSSTANTATDFALGVGRIFSVPAFRAARVGGVTC